MTTEGQDPAPLRRSERFKGKVLPAKPWESHYSFDEGSSRKKHPIKKSSAAKEGDDSRNLHSLKQSGDGLHLTTDYLQFEDPRKRLNAPSASQLSGPGAANHASASKVCFLLRSKLQQ